MDLNYISSIIFKMVSDYLSGNKSISFIRWAIRSFFFINVSDAEVLLLTSVAYDDYAEICFSLHYAICISKRVCGDHKRIVGHGLNRLICNVPTLHMISVFIIDPEPSTISFVMFHPCWLWPAWTTGSMSTQCLLASPSSLCFLSLALHVPMTWLSMPSAACGQQKRGRRPIWPAAPISLWYCQESQNPAGGEKW